MNNRYKGLNKAKYKSPDFQENLPQSSVHSEHFSSNADISGISSIHRNMVLCALIGISMVACDSHNVRKIQEGRDSGMITEPAIPSAKHPEKAMEQPKQFCGMRFSDAPFWIMTEDGKIEVGVYTVPNDNLTAEQVYSRHLSILIEQGKDIVDRDDASMRIEWLDPCDDPQQGTLVVKNVGAFRATLMCQWPMSEQHRAKEICAAIIPNLHIFSPGGCNRRPWMTTPGRATIGLPISPGKVMEPMRMASHPSNVCPPVPFPIPAFGKPAQDR